MLGQLFELQGRFCAGHSMHVIVITVFLTAWLYHMETPTEGLLKSSKADAAAAASAGGLPIADAGHCWEGRCYSDLDIRNVDMILMTIIRCLAILFFYHHFRSFQILGSKHILVIATICTIVSSIIFTLNILNFGRRDISDLKDALFFFLLVIDLNKARTLGQVALNSKSQDEVQDNIAYGMSVLGPSMTLDTLVEILLIGIGSLSGVPRLEVLCGYACIGVLVNYVVFMTFYPACLSFFLGLSPSNKGELSKAHGGGGQINEEDQKPNPVVERLKLIMIASLFVVHAHSRWSFRNGEAEEAIDETVSTVGPSHILTNRNKTEAPADLRGYFTNWLAVSAENIVIFILLLALTVKFIFFEERSLQFEQEEGKQKRRHQQLLEIQDGWSEMDSKLSQRFAATMSIGGQPAASLFPLASIAGDEWIEVGHDSPVEMLDKEVQTEDRSLAGSSSSSSDTLCCKSDSARSLEECKAIYQSELGANALTDPEVIQLVKNKIIQPYQLEKAVGDMERGVGIRRVMLSTAGQFIEDMKDVPYRNYDYSKVQGSCCENVVGYVPVPLGIAGPLLVDGELFHVPMATTEGCLVASTNRGSRALMSCGVTSRLVADGMTRGPVVRFPGIARASEAMNWMQEPDNFDKMKSSFDETSRFARLSKIHVRIAGRLLFIRFVAKTGDAMGMNMLSKGTEKSLKTVQEIFPDMEIISLSGNFCTDKKPSAVNWIEGRGKSVVCEAIIPAEVVAKVLKTSTHALVDVNNCKNMIGSAVSGSIGGFNAHAANIVTAIYIATGQDPAQNVGSSNCMTLMEPWGPDGDDLYISCTMPSIEIGTVGGGTGLPAQGACLAMLGVKGAHLNDPGLNASKLARIVCATVLAGELSLMAALASGELVKSHLRHNRSSTTVSNPISVSSTMRRMQGMNLMVPTLHELQPVCANKAKGS